MNAKLIMKGTGQSLPDFARANLFDPLGVGATQWSNGFNGEPTPASGLRMTPRDLARVGQLILDRGKWGDRIVIPPAWLDASFESYVPCDEQAATATSGTSAASCTAIRRTVRARIGSAGLATASKGYLYCRRSMPLSSLCAAPADSGGARSGAGEYPVRA